MTKLDLSKISTKAPKHLSKEKIIEETEKMHEKIIDLQKEFYAWGKKSILVVLQWMDASGKDGVVRQVFSGINPLGIDAHSWGKPTDEEYAHDFLWRLHEKMPAKWMITIFNRSYYEDILVPSVLGYIDKKIIANRYEHIRNFEHMLYDEWTIVIKCFLHMSKDVQLIRLAERIETEEKYWKHNPGDFDSRKHWDEYMEVYEKIFEEINTDKAPWHIIPTDDKWYKVYLITKLILNTLNSLPMKWPALVDPVVVNLPDKDKNPPKDKKEKKTPLTDAQKETKKAEKNKKRLEKKLEKERAKVAKKAKEAEKKAKKKAEKEAKKAEKKSKKANASKKSEPKTKKPAKKSKKASTQKKQSAKKAPTTSMAAKLSAPARVSTPVAKKASTSPKTASKVAAKKVAAKPAPKKATPATKKPVAVKQPVVAKAAAAPLQKAAPAKKSTPAKKPTK